MMPAWYNRMNPRERVLSWVVAGTIFVLLNVWILSRIFGGVGGSHKEVVARRAKLAEQALYIKERDLWNKREEWIRKHQPVLNNPAEASALLDQLREVANKHNVLIENPAIGTGETTPYHQTVFASIETKSPWPPLVHFLYDVQRPDAFTVFENVNLVIDGSDPTMMRGKFKIARWFAPAQRTK
ncbi:MAG: hypothetical protein DMF20_10540 [Verrucomicrobia bacterium]|jgi:hypothetical protein|nr:MAG: hypothetical protein DMF20_10540 [Verrucomicrobiota bacterium]